MCVFVSPSVIVPNTTVEDGEVATDKVPKYKRALYATAPRSKVSHPISCLVFILSIGQIFPARVIVAGIAGDVGIGMSSGQSRVSNLTLILWMTYNSQNASTRESKRTKMLKLFGLPLFLNGHNYYVM